MRMESDTQTKLVTVETVTFVAGIVVAFIFPPAALPLFAVCWYAWRKRRKAEKAAARRARTA